MAWVMRAVEMMPVARPEPCANSKIDGIALSFDWAQLLTSASGPTPITSLRAFTPAIMAEAVGALSDTCASWE